MPRVIKRLRFIDFPVDVSENVRSSSNDHEAMVFPYAGFSGGKVHVCLAGSSRDVSPSPFDFLSANIAASKGTQRVEQGHVPV